MRNTIIHFPHHILYACSHQLLGQFATFVTKRVNFCIDEKL
jgi:hypothetical protein